jgi:hypothetical protein
MTKAFIILRNKRQTNVFSQHISCAKSSLYPFRTQIQTYSFSLVLRACANHIPLCFHFLCSFLPFLLFSFLFISSFHIFPPRFIYFHAHQHQKCCHFKIYRGRKITTHIKMHKL